jgi:hypothetical protein
MGKRKRTNNDLQNITYKTKDRVTWTPLKTNNIHKRIYTVTSLNLYSRVNDILYSLALSLFNYLSNMTGASSWTGTTPLPKHMSSPPVFSGVHVTRSLVLYVMFCRSLFVLFLLPIVLSVLLLSPVMLLK